MPSQKDGMVRPATVTTRIMPIGAALPRSRAMKHAGRHRQPAPMTSARMVSSRSARRCAPISSMTGGRSRASGRNRRAAALPAHVQVLLRDRQVEAEPAAHLGDALRRDLGVRAQHDCHGIAGMKRIMQEDDDRHAEQHDREIERGAW